MSFVETGICIYFSLDRAQVQQSASQSHRDKMADFGCNKGPYWGPLFKKSTPYRYIMHLLLSPLNLLGYITMSQGGIPKFPPRWHSALHSRGDANDGATDARSKKKVWYCRFPILNGEPF